MICERNVVDRAIPEVLHIVVTNLFAFLFQKPHDVIDILWIDRSVPLPFDLIDIGSLSSQFDCTVRIILFIAERMDLDTFTTMVPTNAVRHELPFSGVRFLRLELHELESVLEVQRDRPILITDLGIFL